MPLFSAADGHADGKWTLQRHPTRPRGPKAFPAKCYALVVDRLWEKFLNEPLTAWLTVFFSFLIVVVTAIYTAATIAYTRVAGRQLRVMEETLAVARDTMEISQRAYAAVSDLNLVDAIRVGTPTTYSIDFTNNGLTPAHDVETEQSSFFHVGMLQENFDYPRAQTPPSRGTWHSKAAFSRTLANPSNLTAEDIANYEAGRLRFYVIGRIKYRDVFGKEHQTRFCFFSRLGTLAFAQAETNNSAD